MPKLHTFTAALPGGGTESRKSSRDLRLAVVAATRAGDRAVQLEASISRHRAEAAADLRNDGIRHPSIKEARRVASIRDAEVVADLERLRVLRELPAEELVEPFVWGWYEDEEAAARGRANARKVGHVAGIVAVDAPAPEWDLCISADGGYSRPNAADEPGGTATPTKELDIMAKHINSVTLATATKGETITETRTSAHRTYVSCSAVQRADGSQLVVSWHLTEAAARKFLTSTEFGYSLKRAGEGAKALVLPVECEVKLTKKEIALRDGANEIMAEQARAAEADAVVKLSGEMTEPVVAAEEAPEAEVVETETIVAPVEETPAPVKVRKPRAPKAAPAPAPAVEIAQPVLDEEWKVRAMGEYKAGDRVVLNDGRFAVVVGPGERKVETIKVRVELTDKMAFRYLKNIKPAS